MFAQFGPRLIRVVLGQQGQQRAAEQGHVGQQTGVAAARTILVQQRVAPPVVAHFDFVLVLANQAQPLFRAMVAERVARQIIAAFGAGLAGLFDRPLAAHHQQAAGIGEVGRQRFDGKGMEAPLFDAAVSAGGLDKKGVPARASKARACFQRPGWLPLICSRESPPFYTMTRAVARWQCKASAVMIFPSRAGWRSSNAVAAVCSQRGVPSF